MILESLQLNNIRSYLNEKIEFNKGITVLSGDIGAGKSTVMLAIEFALFGLMTNDSGNSLLRKGANDGSVELTFTLNNKKITVKRFLKRKTEGIRQANGALIIDDVQKELTPIELKQVVTSILGYPQDSAKKSLIYRYTTYTPQEELKQILYDEADERLATIRKIFGIDKYQRINDNAATFTRVLRENKREMLGKISDIEIKKEQLKKITEEKNTLLAKEKESESKTTAAKQKVSGIKLKLFSAEEELKRINETKKEKLLLEEKIRQKKEHELQLKKEIEKLKNEISSLKQKTNPELLSELKKKLNPEIKNEISKLNDELLAHQKITGELESEKKHSEKIKAQVTSIDDCPLCLQKVSHEHKAKIISEEESRIKSGEPILEKTKSRIAELKSRITELNKLMQESSNAEKEMSLMTLQIKNLNEKELHLLEKTLSIEKNTGEISELTAKNSILAAPDSEKFEKDFSAIKKELEEVLQIERSSELEKMRLTTEIKNSEKFEAVLKFEINEKEKTRTNIEKIDNLENWIEKKFTNIVSLIEQHVLSRIYFTFNDQFREIFSLLIDDERLLPRINEQFTPLIEQNGYETEFANLSGGEKASISLAYRLALNTAINTIMPNINTKGLLLLDEPTDGFSAEQIDSMKDVFEKINTQQTIIVSHENKIESIANQVIRIAKKGHESIILS